MRTDNNFNPGSDTYAENLDSARGGARVVFGASYPELIEDIAQTVAIKMHETMKTTVIQYPKTYAWSAGFRAALDQKKKLEKEVQLPDNDENKGDAEVQQFCTTVYFAEFDNIKNAWQSLLHHYHLSLEALPNEDKTIFFGRHLEGLTNQELALRTGKSEGAVRRQWARLHKKISKELKARISRQPQSVLKELFLHVVESPDGLATIQQVCKEPGLFESYLDSMK